MHNSGSVVFVLVNQLETLVPAQLAKVTWWSDILELTERQQKLIM